MFGNPLALLQKARIRCLHSEYETADSSQLAEFCKKLETISLTLF